jgi:hypothetical protein
MFILSTILFLVVVATWNSNESKTAITKYFS